MKSVGAKVAMKAVISKTKKADEHEMVNANARQGIAKEAAEGTKDVTKRIKISQN